MCYTDAFGHRKVGVVARHRAEQVAPSDVLVAGLPGRRVVRIPVRAAMIAAHAVCTFLDGYREHSRRGAGGLGPRTFEMLHWRL